MRLPPTMTLTPVVIRTHFGDDEAWRRLCEAIGVVTVDLRCFINDPALESLTPAEILEQMPTDSGQSCVYLADSRTMEDPEHPLIAMDLSNEIGRTFRIAIANLHEFHANLWIGNMEFEEFADAVDRDGVFRGFAL